MKRDNGVWSFIGADGKRVECLTLEAALFMYGQEPDNEHHDDMRSDYKPINW